MKGYVADRSVPNGFVQRPPRRRSGSVRLRSHSVSSPAHFPSRVYVERNRVTTLHPGTGLWILGNHRTGNYTWVTEE